MEAGEAERIAIVANPRAGRGRGARVLRRLRRAVEAERVEVTSAPGQAAGLAHEVAEDGAELLLVVGGDGTLREVAQGLVDASRSPAVGLIPAGTCDNQARGLGVPVRTEKAIEVALSGAERPVDVWLWNGEAFLGVAGVGFDAAVANRAGRFRRVHGTLAYVAGLCATLPKQRPFELAIDWPEGQWSGQAWMAAFGNHSTYGGRMRIVPGAVVDDGMLDAVVVGEMSRPRLFTHFPRVFRGTHTQVPGVHTARAGWFGVRASGEYVILDGDVVGTLPAVVARAQRPLVVRVPREQGEGA